MTKTLKETTEFFANTMNEAEGIVSEMKNLHGTINHSITRKEKQGEEYFIIKTTVEYMKAKDLLEGAE